MRLCPIVFIKDVCEYSAFTDIILADNDVAIARWSVGYISVGSGVIDIDNVSSNYASARYLRYIRSGEHRSETSTDISTERDQIRVTCLYFVYVSIGIGRILVSPSTVADIANVVIVIERFFSAVCVTATALLIVVLMPSIIVVGERDYATRFPLAIVSTHTLDSLC